MSLIRFKSMNVEFNYLLNKRFKKNRQNQHCWVYMINEPIKLKNEKLSTTSKTAPAFEKTGLLSIPIQRVTFIQKESEEKKSKLKIK